MASVCDDIPLKGHSLIFTSGTGSPVGRDHRRPPRQRSNTTHSYSDRFSHVDEEPEPEPRIAIRSNRVSSATHSVASSPHRDEWNAAARPAPRPSSNRASTFEGPTRIHRDDSAAALPRLSRTPTESSVIQAGRSQLRPVKTTATAHDTFGDGGYDSHHDGSSSPERSYGERSISPATSYSSIPSRNASWSTAECGNSVGAKKAPPPPPPSRSKKPPPPPPMKRSALSTSESHQY